LTGTAYRIACLPGDGIGPEVIRGAVTVLEAAAKVYGFTLEFSEHLVGGAAYDAVGTPFPDETRDACDAADAILFGAVGGPKYDGLPWEYRPEAALLAIRKRYDFYANLRPILLYPPLKDACPSRTRSSAAASTSSSCVSWSGASTSANPGASPRSRTARAGA